MLTWDAEYVEGRWKIVGYVDGNVVFILPAGRDPFTEPEGPAVSYHFPKFDLRFWTLAGSGGAR